MIFKCEQCPMTIEVYDTPRDFVKIPRGWYARAEENYLGGGGLLELICSDACMTAYEEAVEARIAKYRAQAEELRAVQEENRRQKLLSRAERVTAGRAGHAILVCRKCNAEEDKGMPAILGQDDGQWTCGECK